jgi:hypothetical protein
MALVDQLRQRRDTARQSGEPSPVACETYRRAEAAVGDRGLCQSSTRTEVTTNGKTTLLAALLALVPSEERIVIVEDSRELAPNHPHVVRIEGRPANTELTGSDQPD